MMQPQFRIIGPDGQESAPFDAEALRSYAQQGYIQPQTMIFDTTLGRWMPAGQHPLLSGSPSRETPTPPRPRKSSGLLIGCIAVPIVLGFIIVIYSMMQVAKRSLDAPASQGQTIITKDGFYAVTVPSEWIVWKTENPENLDYIDPAKATGFDLGPFLTGQYHQTDLARAMDNLTRTVSKSINATPTGATKSLTVGGFPALQHEILDNDPNNRLKYRLTLILTPKGIYEELDFVQVDADSSLVSDLDNVLGSFHTVPPKNAAKSAPSSSQH